MTDERTERERLAEALRDYAARLRKANPGKVYPGSVIDDIERAAECGLLVAANLLRLNVPHGVDGAQEIHEAHAQDCERAAALLTERTGERERTDSYGAWLNKAIDAGDAEEVRRCLSAVADSFTAPEPERGEDEPDTLDDLFPVPPLNETVKRYIPEPERGEGALLPCPFCGAQPKVRSNRDWHRIEANHDLDCVMEGCELMWPATDEDRDDMIAAWNLRAASLEPAQGREPDTLITGEQLMAREAMAALWKLPGYKHHEGNSVVQDIEAYAASLGATPPAPAHDLNAIADDLMAGLKGRAGPDIRWNAGFLEGIQAAALVLRARARAPQDATGEEVEAPIVAAVFRFPNGMMAVTDQRGQQIPELQGRFEEVEARIREAVKGREGQVEWKGWRPAPERPDLT